MSEETKKQPETEQEQAAAETKAPAADPISRKLNPLQKRPKRKTGSAKNPKSWKP